MPDDQVPAGGGVGVRTLRRRIAN